MEELQKVFAHTQHHVLHSADTGHFACSPDCLKYLWNHNEAWSWVILNFFTGNRTIMADMITNTAVDENWWKCGFVRMLSTTKIYFDLLGWAM